MGQYGGILYFHIKIVNKTVDPMYVCNTNSQIVKMFLKCSLAEA